MQFLVNHGNAMIQCFLGVLNLHFFAIYEKSRRNPVDKGQRDASSTSTFQRRFRPSKRALYQGALLTSHHPVLSPGNSLDMLFISRTYL